MTRAVDTSGDERRAIVSRMRQQGMTAYEIARKLAVTPKTIYQDIARINEVAMAAVVGDMTPRIASQLETIDHLKRTLHELLKNESGSNLLLRVVDRLLDVMEREAKLLGLDAPDELRLDASTMQEVVALVVRATLPHIEDPEKRVALANEVDGIVGRYVVGQWSAPESNSNVA